MIIISSYIHTNEDNGNGHLPSIKEKTTDLSEATTAKILASAKFTNSNKKSNDVGTQTKTKPEWKQFFQNFKQGNTVPIVTATIVGLITGVISGKIQNKIEPESLLWIPLWIIESRIRKAIITDLQNNMNLDDIQFRKRHMETCAWLSSWITYLLLTNKKPSS